MPGPAKPSRASAWPYYLSLLRPAELSPAQPAQPDQPAQAARPAQASPSQPSKPRPDHPAAQASPASPTTCAIKLIPDLAPSGQPAQLSPASTTSRGQPSLPKYSPGIHVRSDNTKAIHLCSPEHHGYTHCANLQECNTCSSDTTSLRCIFTQIQRGGPAAVA